MKSRGLITFGACSGALGVIFGAFAAHGLKSWLSPYLLNVFETGVQYQLIHTLAILCCGMMGHVFSGVTVQKYVYRAGICFMIGIFCFSGSLYLLAFTGVKWLGPVTPFGGLCFIAGWMMMAVAGWKLKEVNS